MRTCCGGTSEEASAGLEALVAHYQSINPVGIIGTARYNDVTQFQVIEAFGDLFEAAPECFDAEAHVNIHNARREALQRGVPVLMIGK